MTAGGHPRNGWTGLLGEPRTRGQASERPQRVPGKYVFIHHISPVAHAGRQYTTFHYGQRIINSVDFEEAALKTVNPSVSIPLTIPKVSTSVFVCQTYHRRI
jgi:hypothetical protein